VEGYIKYSELCRGMIAPFPNISVLIQSRHFKIVEVF
jgi:hypothetical protein